MADSAGGNGAILRPRRLTGRDKAANPYTSPMTSMPRCAVFGHPIAHSLSPRLHALFAEQTGILLEYTAIDAAPDEFGQMIREFLARGGCGANVTLPHKAAAFALADVHTPTAQRLGVANVLTLLPDGRVEADSNDGAGMIADMRDRLAMDPGGRDVLLLGAGGAARAAAFALLDADAQGLTIANRTPARAQALVDALSEPERVRAATWMALEGSGSFDLIVNATSAGVQHAALALPPNLVKAHTFAYDLSYGPAARPFVEWSQAAGCAVATDGLGMLVETAAASFERWHGVRPDVDAALKAIRAGIHP
jgi:shikimate dehydrogenase